MGIRTETWTDDELDDLLRAADPLARYTPVRPADSPVAQRLYLLITGRVLHRPSAEGADEED